jgi:hypothetical protein
MQISGHVNNRLSLQFELKQDERVLCYFEKENRHVIFPNKCLEMYFGRGSIVTKYIFYMQVGNEES